MSAPQPPVAIDNQCAVIYNNTLYVYSPDALQALPLHTNGTWSQLHNGVSVTGAACVHAYDGGDGSNDALWVVGGVANNSQQNYPGLQRYGFANKTWETVSPVTSVTQNRMGHAATFINSTSSILVYAGDQDNADTPSIQTFSISTQPPYNVLSYSSLNPPVSYPMLLPWSPSAAITVGGAADDTSVRLFDAEAGAWEIWDTSLPQPLKNASEQQATIVTGSDGSQVLEIYDMSVSPNTVSDVVLADSGGQPAPAGQTPAPSTNSRKRKRVTLNDWPAYNDTNAPSYTRNGASLVQGSTGMVAMVGGDSDDQSSVALFNTQDNSWVNNQQFFGDSASKAAIASSSTTSSSSSSTSTSNVPTATPTPPPLTNGDSSHIAVILGATLGSVLGLILILVIVLIILRNRRNKQTAQEQADNEDKTRRLSFADRGDPGMMEANINPQVPAAAAAPVLAQQASHQRLRSQSSQDSDSSTSRLIPRAQNRLAQNNNVEMRQMNQRGDQPVPPSFLATDSSRSIPSEATKGDSIPTVPTNSSGWSKYFSSGSSRAASGHQPGPAVFRQGSFFRASGESSSDSNGVVSNGMNLPPLRLGSQFDGDRVGKVVTGSPPTSSHGGVRRENTTSTRESRPWTSSSFASNTSSVDSENWSRIPSSQAPGAGQTQTHGQQDESHWTPAWQERQRDTATSSIYTTAAAREDPYASLGAISEDQRDSSSSGDVSMPSSTSWPRPPSQAPSRGLTVSRGASAISVDEPASSAAASAAAASAHPLPGAGPGVTSPGSLGFSAISRAGAPTSLRSPPGAKQDSDTDSRPGMRLPSPVDETYDSETEYPMSARIAPPAFTAIPVPASTARSYAVKAKHSPSNSREGQTQESSQAQRQQQGRDDSGSGNDMSWVNFGFQK